MAFAASAVSPSSFRIKLFNGQPCQLPSSLQIRAWNLPTSAKCSVKLPAVAQFHEPHKAKMPMNNIKEKLWEVIPDPVKDFPWKKAEDISERKFLIVGQEALKWSLIVLFVLSSVSDVIYSISRNKELMIPLGLFVGCMVADFLKETSRELFLNWKGRGLSQNLLGIGCFFVLVKIIFTYFLVPGQIFLLHVANGGLMQVLWFWKSLLEEQDRDDRESSLLEDASTAMNAEG
ncbi:hypothetical protein F0562_027923 [Nyssa sinensis]|uniref:Uncharacterized protein n=1 Tax=Nyssa sinensis TaxID=561372 RepID=A0A5J5B6Q0_9ASTE|nr:hypothetical protein F0562_027923 [Nyssa sinensis]